MDRGLKKGCRTLIDIVLVAVSLLSPWLGSCRKEIVVSNPRPLAHLYEHSPG